MDNPICQNPWFRETRGGQKNHGSFYQVILHRSGSPRASYCTCKRNNRPCVDLSCLVYQRSRVSDCFFAGLLHFLIVNIHWGIVNNVAHVVVCSKGCSACSCISYFGSPDFSTHIPATIVFSTTCLFDAEDKATSTVITERSFQCMVSYWWAQTQPRKLPTTSFTNMKHAQCSALVFV